MQTLIPKPLAHTSYTSSLPLHAKPAEFFVRSHHCSWKKHRDCQTHSSRRLLEDQSVGRPTAEAAKHIYIYIYYHYIYIDYISCKYYELYFIYIYQESRSEDKRFRLAVHQMIYTTFSTQVLKSTLSRSNDVCDSLGE